VLGSILARDGYLPRQLHTRGDRLAFSNGIIALSGAAIALIVIFNADVSRLIQLYIVGVFVSFTMSQIGMVKHWTRYLKVELQRGVQGVLERGGAAWGLFFLVFFAVVREGVELALLLFAAPGEGKLVGSLIGLALAVGVGVLIYAFGRRIDLRTFFKVTTMILILFAAGLFAHAAHEFAEAGPLAAIEGPKLWSTAAVLPDESGLGAVLRAFLGYQDEPTVLELVAYVGYFVVVWLLSKTNLTRQPVRTATEVTRTA